MTYTLLINGITIARDLSETEARQWYEEVNRPMQTVVLRKEQEDG